MERLTRALVLFVLVFVFTPGALRSGETGKIAGKVTDKVNGETLAGANIVIVGTTMGAATNLDGHYTILNVPPGSHSLRVSFVGYTTMTSTRSGSSSTRLPELM